MPDLAFDTLKFSKRLTEAGFTRQQAEALAEEQAHLIDERLATKRDLKELEQRMTIRLGSMMVLAVAIVATLVKLL